MNSSSALHRETRTGGFIKRGQHWVDNLMARFLEIRFPSLVTLKQIPGWTTGYAPDQRFPDRKIRLRRLDRCPDPFLARWYRSLKIWIYPGDESSQCAYLHGFYEPNLLCVLDGVLKPGMVFLDIGAHMGLLSLFASRKVGPSKSKVTAM